MRAKPAGPHGRHGLAHAGLLHGIAQRSQTGGESKSLVLVAVMVLIWVAERQRI